MSLPHCGAHSFQPSQPTLRHIPKCFCRFSFFRFLFKLLSTNAEQQIPYGEREGLLLQLLSLQPCMEGMVLGVLSKMLVIETVFFRFSFFRFLFKLLSTTAEQQIPYGEREGLLLQLMMGQLCMRIMLGWVLLMVADERHLSLGMYK